MSTLAATWPGTPALATPGDDAEAMRSLYTQTPSILVGNAVGVALVLAIFWPFAPWQTLLAWAAAGVVLWILRLGHWARFIRQPEASAPTLLAWRRSWMALVLALGSVWGVAVWVFWGLGDAYRQLALILIVYAYCLASVQLLSTQPRVFLAFLCVLLLPTVVRVASDPHLTWRWQLAGVMVLLFAITWLLGRHFAAALHQAIVLKTRTEELAAQLQVEKAQAEAASRAKTQFFAAASHDLRQPLHAMALFAEALRLRSKDKEALRLIDSINESVDALESLFGELLDITRIDSGGVQVKPASIAMREVFARLRLSFEPAAFEKGLMLRFRGHHHLAYADALVLERMLRNLVSNAIRYTDHGGIVVACRSRGGMLSLQVWDSGRGLSKEHQQRIFEEFYQVDPSRPSDPHQRKGMGLGLAIVQRLAHLMGTQVTVSSTVGRGSVFSFEVPKAQATAHPSASWNALPAGLPLDLQNRLMVVVEDDAAVREGLEVLLHSWGAQVLTFSGAASLRQALPGMTRKPDLALVDYRLDDPESQAPQAITGLDVLKELRAHWPHHAIPAIVITGTQSLQGHEHTAAQHDYHVLLKPVLPNRLRAMIAFKLAPH